MSDKFTVPKFERVDSSLVVTIIEKRLREAEVVQQLRESILQQLQKGSVQNVILDLSAVEFVGSIAFLAFLAIRKHPTVDKIYLCGLSENVREVFAVCRLLPGPNSPVAPFSEAQSVANAIKHVSG